MATTVKITETYDLKTTVGKLGIIGIHTPQLTLLQKLYPGLIKNHRFVRFLKCDVVGACASYLPADPLQVGVTSGKVAPEDMFNPILMTAVTNKSFDSIVSTIYRMSNVGSLGSVCAQNLGSSSGSNFSVYYALLSQNGKFKKAMPQTGFSMRSLVPICHTLLSTYGNVSTPGIAGYAANESEEGDALPVMNESSVNSVSASDFTVSAVENAVTLRGKSVRMPRMPLHYTEEAQDSSVYPYFPETFVGMLITPPAKLNEFYYRMRVTWTVRFEEVITSTDVGDWSSFTGVGGLSYASNITYAKSEEELPVKDSSIDADGIEVEKIMES